MRYSKSMTCDGHQGHQQYPAQFNLPINNWYDQAFNSAYRQGQRLGLSCDEAKDLAQDAIVRIWRQIERGRTPVGFSQDGLPCNLRVVVHGCYCEHLRKIYMQGPVIDLDRALKQEWIGSYPSDAIDNLNAMARAFPESSPDSGMDAEENFLTDKVKAIIASDKIDEDTKPLLEGRLFKNKSFRKIAREHNVGTTNVRNKIIAGLAVIRQELAV